MQTVLIAEDAPALRERIEAALREHGYFTIQTETAQDALGVLRSVDVDLLLTRERLADAEGTTLAAMARHRGLEELVIVLLTEEGSTGRPALESGTVDAVLGRGADVGSVVRLVRRLLRPVVIRTPAPAVSDAPCALPRA
ncbi:MAG: response regulator [Planctomycetota bacterium]